MSEKSQKRGLLANAFSSHRWDSKITSANTTRKEMWLGYVLGTYGMVLTSSIVNSYYNRYLTDVLGFLQKEEDALPADIQAMVDERAEARKNRDWKRSDELRDAIKAAGYILEDSREGQKVRKAV